MAGFLFLAKGSRATSRPRSAAANTAPRTLASFCGSFSKLFQGGSGRPGGGGGGGGYSGGTKPAAAHRAKPQPPKRHDRAPIPVRSGLFSQSVTVSRNATAPRCHFVGAPAGPRRPSPSVGLKRQPDRAMPSHDGGSEAPLDLYIVKYIPRMGCRVATTITENLVAAKDREPTSSLCRFPQRHNPKDGPSSPRPACWGRSLSMPPSLGAVFSTAGKPHETYDNSFGFSSCSYFIHGFRPGNRWRGRRCRCWY